MPQGKRSSGFTPILMIILLLFVLAAGGWGWYNFIYNSPQNVLARTTTAFSKLRSVHADLDIKSLVRSQAQGGALTTQNVNIVGFSDVNLSEQSQKMHLNVSASPNSLEMDAIILKNEIMYLQMPILGEGWIQFSFDELKESGNLPIDPRSSDYVSQSLGLLKSANKDTITKLEDEVIDGTKTSHYRLGITTSQYIEYLKSIKADSLIDSFENAAIQTDLWIDKKTSHTIRVKSEIKNLSTINPQTKTKIGTNDTTAIISYSKFDQPLEVMAPTGEIIKYSDLLNSQ